MPRALFETAYKKLIKHEGGYVNDPTDRGGETYCGISRKYYPNWNGWGVIDDAKAHGKPIPDMDLLVQRFYKTEYWDFFKGDEHEQVISEEVFDTAVNMGKKTAITFLQRALNVLNRNQSLYPDLEVDGVYGDKTGLAIRKAAMDYKLLFKLLNVQQGNKYIEIMLNDPTQEKFCRGWFERVEFVK